MLDPLQRLIDAPVNGKPWRGGSTACPGAGSLHAARCGSTLETAPGAQCCHVTPWEPWAVHGIPTWRPSADLAVGVGEHLGHIYPLLAPLRKRSCGSDLQLGKVEAKKQIISTKGKWHI